MGGGPGESAGNGVDPIIVSLVLAALGATAAPNFQAMLDEFRSARDLPGIGAVVTDGNEVIFAGGSGVADIESGRPMTADTVVYAGSLTKILTATLTLRLIEIGQLSLDTRADGIAIASGESGADVRVEHLLTHASGLEREGDFGYWFTADFPDRDRLETYLSHATLRSDPGTALHYSNVGYAALGLVIEQASGRTYGETLRHGLLEPLGMKSTGARGPAPDVASGYTPRGRLLPSSGRPFAGVGRQVGERRAREYHDARAMSPAFGAYTTACDLGILARFLLGHGNDDILSKSARQRMRTRQTSGWGLGLKIGTIDGRTVARHEGWFAAHRSHLLLDMRADIGVVVLSTSDDAQPAEIAAALYRAALQRQSPSPPSGL